MEYSTEGSFPTHKFNKTITKFNISKNGQGNAKKQFMLTQMGFLKKKYTTPDYEDVGFPIKREKLSRFAFDDKISESNLRILDRHRSKETRKKMKQRERKEKSLGKKEQNTPSHKRKKTKYKKKHKKGSQNDSKADSRMNYVLSSLSLSLPLYLAQAVKFQQGQKD